MIDSVGMEDAPLSSFPTGKKMDYHVGGLLVNFL